MLARVVHISRSFREAEAWDRAQQRAMTPRQRQRAARILKQRVFGRAAPDVRQCRRVR